MTDVTDRWLDRFTDQPFKTAWLVLSTATALLTVVAGLVIRITDPHEIHSYGEGLWWAIQTVTTVGYGDVVPQSVLGRLMAALIMITGIAFLTVTTAAVTNIFIERARQRRDGGRDVHREIAALSAQITELADEVRALRKSDTTP